MCSQFVSETGDDAAKAVSYGVDGILVSNHGARQLDGVPATVGSTVGLYPSVTVVHITF